MVRLLPAMSPEPPDGYVAFVARHLESLRQDAARVVGDAGDADLLYPEVLTDVAGRWHWLHLLGSRSGRDEAPERYLREAFARRSARWQPDQMFEVEVDVWESDRPGTVTSPNWATVSFGPHGMAGLVEEYVHPRHVEPKPTWSSVALLLAPQLTPGSEPTVGPLAEATIAWFHAYEAHRRRRLYTVCALLLVLMMLMTRLRYTF